MRILKWMISQFFSIIFTILVLILIISAIIFFITHFSKREFSISSKKELIGVIKLTGVIRRSDNFIKNLKDFVKNDKIKGIIISINSPGGAVVPSQEIYREILKLRSKKPIIAYIKSVGASGAYYIASACNKIFANPGSITGSIGVIAEFTNIQELLGKIGIKSITIKSGKFKDIGNPAREMTDEEKQYLKNLIMNIYNQFLSDVAKARNIPVEKLKKIADGRVFTGVQALNYKLIDRLGNFDDVVQYLKKVCKIKGEPEIVYPSQKFSIINEITDKIYNFILTKNHLKIMFLSE